MRRFHALIAAALVLSLPLAVEAANITGIMVFSTDDFGDPSGVASEATKPESNLWLTSLQKDVWYALGVFEGLPPDSVTTRNPKMLNNPSTFGINIPLVEGDNYLTMVGQPGRTTVGDEFARFAVNLYFDGRLDIPGISVLFERYAPLDGGSTSRSRAQWIYSFGAKLFQVRVPGVDDSEGYDSYDDGIVRVTVPAASMVYSRKVADFTSLDPNGIDLVHDYELRPSKDVSKIEATWPGADYIGTLIVTVEPSLGQPSGAGGGFIPGPGTTGGSGGSGSRTGYGETGLGAPYVPPYNPPVEDYGSDGDAGYADEGDAGAYEGDTVVTGSQTTPTPKDAVDLVKNWLQSGLETQTPGSPTPGADGTTPTPAAHQTPSAAASHGTPTPAAPGLTVGTPASATTAGTGTPGTKTPSITPTPLSPTPTPAQTGSPIAATPTPKAKP